MSNIKSPFLKSMMIWLLLVSGNGYAITAIETVSQPAGTQETSNIHYVTAELLELHPQKIVTSSGTYSTVYIPVLDQRIPGVYSGKRVNPDSKGKVRLKMSKEKQLLEVILY